MNITPKQIKGQYERVKRDGWVPWFAEAAKKANTSTAHFLAIGSRETNLENIRGDFRAGKYHGFGVMQVDIGTDPEYAAHWTPADIEPSIRRGGEIYEAKVDQVIEGQGKSLTVKGKKFVGRKVELDDVRRIATAAYNSGLWAYFHFSNHAHVDLSTTGKDYSRDVYDRALVFAELLEADGEVDAYAKEIRAQGKYATEEEKAKVKEPLVTEPVTEPTPAPQINVEHAEKVEAPPVVPKPETVKIQSLTQSLLSKIMAGGTAVVGAGTAVFGFVTQAFDKHPLPMTILVLGMLAIAAYMWNESKKRHDAREALIIQKAASQTENTVILT